MKVVRCAALVAIFPVLLLAISPVSACLATCFEYEVRTFRGRLLQSTGEPIIGAKLIIRDASIKGKGPRTFCGGRKGKVVARTKTGKNGSFDLHRLPAGLYWVTYLHPEQGESFLVAVSESAKAETVDLSVDSYGGGGFCYLVDIERNATKPEGWPAPVKENEEQL